MTKLTKTDGTKRKRLNIFLSLTSAVLLLSSTLAVAALLAAAHDAAAASKFEPSSSLAEKTAKWWRWALSAPASTNPLLDSSGANCGVNQPPSGNVWYLAGTVGGSAVTRTCTIPAGSAIFFPVVNVVEGDVPSAFDENVSRADAKAVIDSATNLSVTVDGVDVTSTRAQSPIFSVNLPEDNILGAPSPLAVKFVSDGYWVLLQPLSLGTHTISFHADYNVGGNPASQDVTYNLTVE